MTTLSLSIGQAAQLAKNVAAAMGVGGILWSAYSVSGLPVPATIHQVDERLGKLSKRMDGITIDQLEGQRSVIRLTRVSLRNEQTALEHVLTSAVETGTKRTISRRVLEIADELRILETRDDGLRKRIDGLQP
jgi:hypothetical protein